MLQLLLGVGVDPNSANEVGRRALTLAADLGLVKSCEILLKNRANVDQWCHQRWRNPLHAAADQGRLEVIKLLHAWKADFAAANTVGNVVDTAKAFNKPQAAALIQ